MHDEEIRALVIEDNPAYASLLRDMLENREKPSFDIVCVGRLLDGLEQLATNEFDVALLDLQLPESRGLNTFNSVYAEAPKLPIIVLSGLDDEDLAVQAVRTGAQDYLVKDDDLLIQGDLLPRAIQYAIERKQSTNYYRALLDSLHDHVIVVDDDYRITDINHIFLQRLGRSREEVIGKLCFKVLHGLNEPCSGENGRCLAQGVWETGQAQRAVHIQEEEGGTLRWLDIVASPLHQDDQTSVIEAYRDVTAERRLEERLAGVNALGRELMLTRDERQITQVAVDAARILSQSPVCGLWLLDEEQGELVCWAHSHGAHVVAQTVIPLDGEAHLISDVIQGRAPIYVPDIEGSPAYKAIGPSSESGLIIPLIVKGHVIGALVAESPQPDAFGPEDEQLLSTLAAQAAVAIENARLHDKAEQEIAERRQAEEALEKHATRLTLLNEVSGRITATLDLDHLFDKAASLVQEHFGYHHVAICIVEEESDVVVVKSQAGQYAHVFSPDDHLKLNEGLVGWVARHGEALLVNDVEEDSRYVNLHPDSVSTRSELSIPIQVGDTTLGVLDVQSPRQDAFDEDDLMVMETLADQIAIAVENARLYEAEKEQRRLVEQSQAQLVQSEKLAATGRLTASLAHEINNPLQAIHNSLQIMISFDLNPQEQQEYLQMADEDVERLINMVGRMLDFARRPEQEKKLVKVNQVVEKTLKLSSKYLQHSNVALQKDLASDLPPVLGTPGELQQVFLNLVLNAIDAMPRGGRLRVVSYVDGDDHVTVSFTDTGRGIPPEYRGRIFEPFFSTKEEGTGLGLSVSYNVVKSHRGEIDVESEVGEGATFTVRLPILSR